MVTADAHFNLLGEEMTTLSEFLAKFADLLMRETSGEISLDGRRLGFIYRNILANRAVELAKAEVCSYTGKLTSGRSFVESARYVVQSSVPIGLNDEFAGARGSVEARSSSLPSKTATLMSDPCL